MFNKQNRLSSRIDDKLRKNKSLLTLVMALILGTVAFFDGRPPVNANTTAIPAASTSISSPDSPGVEEPEPFVIGLVVDAPQPAETPGVVVQLNPVEPAPAETSPPTAVPTTKSTAAPTTKKSTAGTTAKPTTAAPTTTRQTQPPTTAAPTTPAPTQPPTTAAPTQPPTTAAPTTAAPTQPPGKINAWGSVSQMEADCRSYAQSIGMTYDSSLTKGNASWDNPTSSLGFSSADAFKSRVMSNIREYHDWGYNSIRVYFEEYSGGYKAYFLR